jgi:hypothetical protein
MYLGITYLLFIIATIIFVPLLFLIVKHKGVLQKGILGIQLTLLGCVVFLLADQDNLYGLGFGYTLVGIGTIFSITAIYSKK